MDDNGPALRLYSLMNFTKEAPELVWQINKIRPISLKFPPESHLPSSSVQHLFLPDTLHNFLEAERTESTNTDSLISGVKQVFIFNSIPHLYKSQLATAP